MKLYELTAYEIHDLLIKGKATATEVVRAILDRVEKVENKLNSYVTLMEEVLGKAKEVDELLRAEKPISALMGIPMAIKDNICFKGATTTCSSKILEGFKPPYNATVVEKLMEEGVILIGKTNMDEFAMGSSTETSYNGATRNPWDLDTIPGGSSGGSASAVSSGEATLALGSDTGGSIRQPASFCGVVGMKPTYGRVSRYGLVAFASSLDQIGPITKDVRDCALLMNCICGYDERDSTSAKLEVPDFTKSLKEDIKGLRIGLPKEYFGEGIDPEVERAVENAVKTLEGLGAIFEEVSLPHTEYGIATYYLIAPSEASSNLARYDGVRYGYRAGIRGKGDKNTDIIGMYERTRSEGFGDEVKRRIMLGTYVLSAGYYDAYYLKALKVRTLIKRDFDEAFKRFDCLITPTSPTPAFRIGEKIDDPLKMYLSDIFTISANLAGIPGISIPCGFSKEGLPIGLQILGKPFDEETILRVAYTFEQSTDYHLRRPMVGGER